jgi:predicted dehydrogenase
MMGNKKINLAIIGIGVMGKNHYNVIKNMDDFSIRYIIDPHLNNHDFIDDDNNTIILQDYRAIDLTAIDAALIAAPSYLHAEMGKYFIQNNIATFMEKPLALSAADGHELATLATDHKLPTMVGHIERFNPSVAQLNGMIEKNMMQPKIYEFRRLSGASNRISDSDVILDLMIHDLDILLYLHPDKRIDMVKASGFSQHNNGKCHRQDALCDYAMAMITFDDGMMAYLSASRVTPTRTRKIDITCANGYYNFDLIGHENIMQSLNHSPSHPSSMYKSEKLKAMGMKANTAPPRHEKPPFRQSCQK